jgi:hypothetical protein
MSIKRASSVEAVDTRAKRAKEENDENDDMVANAIAHLRATMPIVPRSVSALPESPFNHVFPITQNDTLPTKVTQSIADVYGWCTVFTSAVLEADATGFVPVAVAKITKDGVVAGLLEIVLESMLLSDSTTTTYVVLSPETKPPSMVVPRMGTVCGDLSYMLDGEVWDSIRLKVPAVLAKIPGVDPNAIRIALAQPLLELVVENKRTGFKCTGIEHLFHADGDPLLMRMPVSRVYDWLESQVVMKLVLNTRRTAAIL